MKSDETIAEIERVSSGEEYIINKKFKMLLDLMKAEYLNGCTGISCEFCEFKNDDDDYLTHLLCDLMEYLSDGK